MPPIDPLRDVHRVLTVCTGNHCRSPVMQYVLAETLGATYSVHSAGTDADVGIPMHPYALDALAARGIDGTSFVSRPLQLALIDHADLILTAEAAHRSTIITLRPNALNRTFTLLQFSRLLQHAPAEQPLSLAHALERARRHRAGLPGDDDLGDPMGSTRQAFVEMTERVVGTADTIAAQVGVRPGSPGG